MKRIILITFFALLSAGLLAQNTYKYVINANGGLRVGGTAKVKVDSMTSNGTDIKFYHGATILEATPGGGSASWGSITGLISSQTDLSTALGLKANANNAAFTGTTTGITAGMVGAMSTSHAANAITGTDITNWGTAYTNNLRWDGGSTSLVAATGRTSLGGTTVGQSLFTLTNPSAITFLRINANNTITTRSAADFKTDLSLENVTNESKATMFANPTFTGVQKVSTTDTLATKAYARSAGGGGSGSGIWGEITGTLSNQTDLQNALNAKVPYPSGSGIPLVVTGTSWGTTITNNSTNWNTAYSDRLKWDGGATDLNAVTGRASLGATTVGAALFMLTNPSAITFLRINANNSITAQSAVDFKTSLSLNNVTNESKATMFTSPVFTGSVPTSGGVTLGRVTSITTTLIAGMVNNITLTGVTTKPYGIMIQTTGGNDITSAVSDSLAFTGGVYHLHVYSVDLITNAEIKVTH